MSYKRDGVEYGSYGQYLRSKNLRVAYCRSAVGMDASKQKKWDAEIQAYRSAVKQGVQPDSTSLRSVEKAMKISDMTGSAYGADPAEA